MTNTPPLRFSNNPRARLRNPQILHFCARASHRSRDAESRQDAKGLGLGHREADDERGEGFEEGKSAAEET